MSKTFIIAEAGVNHNGSLELAEKLVDVALRANCDAVKFQTFKATNLVSKRAQKAAYQKLTTQSEESQLEMIRRLELSYDDFYHLKSYCDQRNIMFMSSPFDIDSVDFLAKLGLSVFKIPSGEITNLPYLRKINSYKRKAILSTGMSTLGEIQAALKILRDCEVAVLHCSTEYPCPYNEVNLGVLHTLKRELSLEIGYSDHTQGIEIPIAAVANGATIIEKHFTLDKSMKGPDHKASLEPHELEQMVSAIRHVEAAISGDGIKRPSQSEIKNIGIVRKSIVAKCVIHYGEILSENNITTKRPADGISPMFWDSIIGKQATHDYNEDDIINEKI